MANTTLDPTVIERHEEEIDIEEPKKYKVLLHNDNLTTFEFVIFLLANVFHKNAEEALYLTQQIHETGAGIAGIYSKEIAEEKVLESMQLARRNNYPLVVTLEEY